MSYNYLTQYNSPNYTPESQARATWGRPRTIEIVAQHWWGDPNTNPTFEGVVATLCNPARQASAHFVATGTGRRVACLVDLNNASWATNSANPYSISIEGDPRCRDEDYDVIAELIAELRVAYGIQLPIKPHREFVATACPGNYDLNRLNALANEKQRYADINKDYGQITIPAPQPPAPTQPEWIRNLNDITDLKLSVLPAGGTKVINLNTLAPLNDVIIPKGTQIDIAKETTVGGKKFYITSYSASNGVSNGLLASDLGVPVVVPPVEKPEWLKNLKDIADVDMYTRSETPVLDITTSQTVQTLPINSKIRVIKSTEVLGKQMLVLDGEKTMIDTMYASNTPISNPTDDLDKRLTALEKLVKVVVDFLTNMFKNFKV
jgi:hypothetical protein